MSRRKSPFVLQKHAPPLMALFAEAVEWATSQSRIDMQPPGHIAVEPRDRGGRYAYWVRYGPASKLQRQYLGAAGSEKHLETVAALDGLKRIKEQAKNLRKLGFEAVEHDAALVIAELCNAGIFTGGGILIGTRAFGSILNHLGYRATPFLGTQDVDIARLKAIKLATPLPAGGFAELLLVPGRLSSKPYSVVPVPELDAHATTLPFLDYLIGDSWQTIIVGRDHLIPVRCPQPARYCLHKLVVASLRSGLENPKIEKDLVQAGILAAILHEEDPGAIDEAADALSAAMVKHARKSFPRIEKLLAGEFPAALEMLRGVINSTKD